MHAKLAAPSARPLGAVGGDGGDVFDLADAHTLACDRSHHGLSARTGRLGAMASGRADAHMNCS